MHWSGFLVDYAMTIFITLSLMLILYHTHRYDMDRANIGMDRKYIGKKGFYIASQNDVRILKSFTKASQKFPKNTIVPV